MQSDAKAIAARPLSRPYSAKAIDGARTWLIWQGHGAATVRSAEAMNTPLWQKAIRLAVKAQLERTDHAGPA